eukprot:611837-Pleurochrysis_carterae.AAC.1
MKGEDGDQLAVRPGFQPPPLLARLLNNVLVMPLQLLRHPPELSPVQLPLARGNAVSRVDLRTG